MFQFFIILAIIIAVLVILVVLMQNSKGGGLSSQFGGGGAQQIIGVKKTGDLLEKTTWIFIILLIALSLASSIALKDSSRGQSNPNIDAAQQSIPSQVPAITDTTQTGIAPLPADTTK